jgi:hypothetical protein
MTDTNQKELGKDYPALPAADRRVPLATWYKNNSKDIPTFEKKMRRKVHYVIQPPHLCNSIASCLTSLDDLIAAQTQKLAALKTHKKGLMQQLFPSPEEVEV